MGFFRAIGFNKPGTENQPGVAEALQDWPGVCAGCDADNGVVCIPSEAGFADGPVPGHASRHWPGRRREGRLPRVPRAWILAALYWRYGCGAFRSSWIGEPARQSPDESAVPVGGFLPEANFS